jgi:hypothetical protein
MFLGLASLPFMEEAYQTKNPVKISREITQALLGEVSEIIGKDRELRELFDDATSVLPSASEKMRAAFSPQNVSREDDWFVQIALSSELSLPLMHELGFLEI